jgi:hypothetical protein
MEQVTVRWICGYYYGPPKWQGTEFYEPDECAKEFETKHTLDEWENCECSAECPKCGATLWQEDDYPYCVELDEVYGD